MTKLILACMVPLNSISAKQSVHIPIDTEQKSIDSTQLSIWKESLV